MAENSKIEWTDHTYNAWRGCTKVSAGCDHCYAEKLSKRNPAVLGEWGPGAKRALSADSYRDQPYKWNREAKAAGERRRVFALSLGDWLDDEVPLSWLFGLLSDATDTDALDWLLLTKRPQNWRPRLEQMCSEVASPEWATRWLDGEPPLNFWIGASAENQAAADERLPILRQIPAAVRFVSVEPLIESVDLAAHLYGDEEHGGTGQCIGWTPPIDWVIVGGESGPGARPCNVQWIRSIVEQCRQADVPCFVKQLGGHVLIEHSESVSGWRYRSVEMTRLAHVEPDRMNLHDRKGGDWSAWPEDLRVRAFPEATA